EDNKLLDVLYDKYQPSSDEKTLENSLKLEIEKALSTLTDREAEVISLYFGINSDNPLTLEGIGKIFKITRERVRQIKEKALNRLRHQSRSIKLRTYFIDLAPKH
ncbi:sigma factor-like helix-turn-helix DNA-binding protein, partial [Candidatus Latescibacterota bacterium]